MLTFLRDKSRAPAAILIGALNMYDAEQNDQDGPSSAVLRRGWIALSFSNSIVPVNSESPSRKQNLFFGAWNCLNLAAHV